MFDKIINWYQNYHGEISWFVIGFLINGCLINLLRGDYIAAAINAILAYCNYSVYKNF